MSILINKQTHVICQGIVGKMGGHRSSPVYGVAAHTPHLRCFLALATLLLGLLGSARGAEPEKFSSAEECFAGFAKASVSANPADSLPYLTDVLQDYIVGNMTYQIQRQVAARTDSAKACGEILKKYKHDQTDITELLQIYDSPGGLGAPAAFVRIGSTIKDKRQFLDDVTAALKKPGDDKVAPKALPKLKDLKVSGDTATGVMVRGKDEEAIFFRRINGSWLVAADPSETDWRKTKK